MSNVYNSNGSLNILIDEYYDFYSFIGEVRRILGVIVSSRRDIPLTIKVNHHLNDIEKKELEETISRFEIDNFVCIN